ncbi:MAG: GNAT family N-acetyltransferase [Actinomycetota bacterium]
MDFPLSIRPANPSDAEAVAAVHVHGWQWGYRGLIPDGILDGLDVSERADRWRTIMTSEDRTASVYLAERGGRVVGFVSCGPARELNADDESTGEVYAIYQEPDVAGTGVGRALFRRAVEDLWNRGFDRAVLWVLETNALARRFYEREGWHTDGATKTENFQGFALHELRYTFTR